MKDFRDLKVWEKAHQLTLAAYRASAHFPDEERFGLTRQLRRASSSIPTNVAEGCGKRGNTEFNRFLQIAAGSASEVEYELLLAKDLGYLPRDAYDDLHEQTVEVKRMLSSLILKVEADRLESA